MLANGGSSAVTVWRLDLVTDHFQPAVHQAGGTGLAAEGGRAPGVAAEGGRAPGGCFPGGCFPGVKSRIQRREADDLWFEVRFIFRLHLSLCRYNSISRFVGL